MSRDPQHLLDGGELAEWAGGQVRGQDVEPRGNAEGQAVLALNMVRSKGIHPFAPLPALSTHCVP